MSELQHSIGEAAKVIKAGGVVAYPTESCFGLGCDPLNTDAVKRILTLKQRPWQKGMIIIAADWQQFLPYALINESEIPALTKVWPGAVTWLLPKKANTPALISGDAPTIAVRVPDHEVARALSHEAGGCIVSTSCNPAGALPAKTAEQVRAYFSLNQHPGEKMHNAVDYIVDAPVGEYENPSEIRDFATGRVLR